MVMRKAGRALRRLGALDGKRIAGTGSRRVLAPPRM
jgi:hypothetical protein